MHGSRRPFNYKQAVVEVEYQVKKIKLFSIPHLFFLSGVHSLNTYPYQFNLDIK